MEYNGIYSSSEITYKVTPNHANNSQCMLEGSSTETSEAYYTIGMQSDAQMA